MWWRYQTGGDVFFYEVITPHRLLFRGLKLDRLVPLDGESGFKGGNLRDACVDSGDSTSLALLRFC